MSNLGHTDENNKVLGYVHEITTVKPTNDYSLSVSGVRYSFVGAVQGDFNVSSVTIRNLERYAYTKENTKSLTAVSGNNKVIVALPTSWGVLKSVKDNNASSAPIEKNFVMQEVDVQGANNFDAVKYKVYIYSSDVALSAIDYSLVIE
jgi:hypothetical protein